MREGHGGGQAGSFSRVQQSRALGLTQWAKRGAHGALVRADVEGEGGHAKLPIRRIVQDAADDGAPSPVMLADRGARRAVEPPQVPREGVETGGIGWRGGGPAPGVAYGRPRGLQGEHQVGPVAYDGGEDVRALRLREGRRSGIRVVAGLAAGPAAVPVERAV